MVNLAISFLLVLAVYVFLFTLSFNFLFLKGVFPFLRAILTFSFLALDFFNSVFFSFKVLFDFNSLFNGLPFVGCS